MNTAEFFPDGKKIFRILLKNKNIEMLIEQGFTRSEAEIISSNNKSDNDHDLDILKIKTRRLKEQGFTTTQIKKALGAV